MRRNIDPRRAGTIRRQSSEAWQQVGRCKHIASALSVRPPEASHLRTGSPYKRDPATDFYIYCHLLTIHPDTSAEPLLVQGQIIVEQCLMGLSTTELRRRLARVNHEELEAEAAKHRLIREGADLRAIAFAQQTHADKLVELSALNREMAGREDS